MGAARRSNEAAIQDHTAPCRSPPSPLFHFHFSNAFPYKSPARETSNRPRELSLLVRELSHHSPCLVSDHLIYYTGHWLVFVRNSAGTRDEYLMFRGHGSTGSYDSRADRPWCITCPRFLENDASSYYGFDHTLNLAIGQSMLRSRKVEDTVSLSKSSQRSSGKRNVCLARLITVDLLSFELRPPLLFSFYDYFNWLIASHA